MLATFDQYVRAVTRNEPHLSDRAQLNKAWRAFKHEMDGAGVSFGGILGRSRNARYDDGPPESGIKDDTRKQGLERTDVHRAVKVACKLDAATQGLDNMC